MDLPFAGSHRSTLSASESTQLAPKRRGSLLVTETAARTRDASLHRVWLGERSTLGDVVVPARGGRTTIRGTWRRSTRRPRTATATTAASTRPNLGFPAEAEKNLTRGAIGADADRAAALRANDKTTRTSTLRLRARRAAAWGGFGVQTGRRGERGIAGTNLRLKESRRRPVCQLGARGRSSPPRSRSRRARAEVRRAGEERWRGGETAGPEKSREEPGWRCVRALRPFGLRASCQKYSAKRLPAETVCGFGRAVLSAFAPRRARHTDLTPSACLS